MAEPVSELLSLQDVLLDYANAFLQVLPSIVLALVVLVAGVSLGSVGRRVVSGFSTRFTDDPNLQSLFGTLTKTLVVVVSIFAAAAVVFPGLSVGHLVSVLGLSSVAIGFAFKDIFENFLAGILILSGRPFTIGDQIKTNDQEGTVQHISIRNTELKTYDGQRVIIPNAKVFTNVLTVRTAYSARRTTFVVGVDYGADVETARRTIEQALASCERVLKDPAWEVRLLDLGDSAIDFHVLYWGAETDSFGMRAAKDEVVTAIKYALDEAGIDIPYPHRYVEFYDRTSEGGRSGQATNLDR